MSETNRRLQILCKWRTLFTGWQLGTRLDSDPEAQAVRDHREATILLRAEVNALTGLLIEKGVFTAAEFDIQLGDEAKALSDAYEIRFPGVSATYEGLSFDLTRIDEIRAWQKGWLP